MLERIKTPENKEGEYLLKEFKEEIRALKEEEASDGKIVHLRNVNPGDLIGEDLQAYNMYKVFENLPERTLENYQMLRNDFMKYSQSIDKTNTSRYYFSQFLANKITGLHPQ